LSPDTPGLAVQLSNFSFVSVEVKRGEKKRRLRFTLVLSLEHPELGQIALGVDGNLAFVNSEGLLVWGPPLTRVGAFGRLRTVWTNPTLERLVTEALARTEYIAELSPDILAEGDGKIAGQSPVTAL
jgi:hypothetical protein